MYSAKRAIFSLVAVAGLAVASGCGGAGAVFAPNINITGTWVGNVNWNQGVSSSFNVPMTMSVNHIGDSVSGTLAANQPAAGVVQLNVSGNFSGSSGTLSATNGSGCNEVDQISVSGNQMSINGSGSGNCAGGDYNYSGILIQQ